MKAVLLAAGKSTRTYPLTVEKPKPLLKVAGKMLLEHNLDQLDGLVDEVAIIVGFKKDMIIETFGKTYKGMKLTYIEQKEQLGTGHAVMQAKDSLDSDFILLYGDDLYFHNSLKKLFDKKNSLLVKEVDDPERFGVVVCDKKGKIEKFVERPKDKISNLVSCGAYHLSKDIFNFKFEKSERGEYEVVDFVIHMIETGEFYCVEAEEWIPIGYPWDLLKANKHLLSKIKTKIDGVVEDDVKIKGEVIIGKGTEVKAGTYIEGPVVIGENCQIGPRAYIRPSTSIGNSCKIGAEVEIKNCIIGDGTKVPHISYLGDSVIGDNCNISAGNVTGNVRHDKGLIRSSVKENLVDTGLNKLGIIVGDDVKTGVNTVFYPGRKVWPGKTTLPGDVIKKDIM